MNERYLTEGGPAFPLNVDSINAIDYGGMTLRDYFAAKAMEGLMARPDTSPGAFDFVAYNDDPERVANWAYLLSDAMLKVRGK